MRRPAGAVLTGGFAATVVVTLLVTASGPWAVPLDGSGPQPLWTTDAAIGTGVAVLGAAVVTAAHLLRLASTPSLRVSALGCVMALLGAGFALLALRRSPAGVTVAPVTVAIARFEVGPNPSVSSSAVPTVVATAVATLVVIAVVGALVRTGPTDLDTSRATRPVAVVAVVGALTVALGASLLPWTVGPDLAGRSLWRSASDTAVAAAVLLLAALAGVVLVHRPPAVRPAVVVAVGAGLAGALVLASRTAFVGRARSPVFSYLLTPATAGVPTRSALNLATQAVLAGAGLVVLAALAVVSLSVLRSTADDVTA